MSSEIQSVELQIKALDRTLDSFINQTNETAEENTKLTLSQGEKVKALNDTIEMLNETVSDLQQKGIPLNNIDDKTRSIGAMVIDSDEYKAFADGKSRSFNLDIQNNTVGTERVPGSDTTWSDRKEEKIIESTAFRSLRMRDVIPSSPTSKRVVEYQREETFVNNAAEVVETGVKPESDITFSKDSANIKTIAHWIKVSKQLRDDAPLIMAWINRRMRYGLELRIDQQIISGDGAGDNLEGILNAAGVGHTAYVADNLGTGLVSTTFERLKEAQVNVKLNDYMAEAFVMNPVDVMRLDLDQESDGIYIASSPRMFNNPVAWGLPIIESNNVPAGTFMCGAFSMSTEILNRMGMQVQMFEQDEDNVQTNLITIRAEEDMGMAHYRPASLFAGPAG